ncbi:glycosyltransferase family 4 protein [Gryllotalpicola protaetiae]|uniref:Glycosyltransferase n=1 Tax=Gryllotalpicola protaetiae TaxID=2419771 RepID=A0A387BRM1_9MICO|nr:glycosyltransferase family 4 protein [Gryllotalpicola protaetiae]AYG03709.1 glycosyltransferase [Gryllotalpicola protaetiae]
MTRPLTVFYAFPHALGEAGIGWTAWNQAAELAAAGHRVHVFAASVSRPVPQAASVQTTLQRGRVRMPHRAIGRERAFELHDLLAARALRRVAAGEHVDVVHGWPLNGRRTFAAAASLGIASVREVPNTHTEHAYQVVAAEYRKLGLEQPRGKSHTRSESRLAREQAEYETATALLTPSGAVRQTFVDRGFAPARLLRHRYGVRPEAVRPHTPRAPGTGLHAVFLGRCDPRKGLHYALRAWLDSAAAGRGRFTIYGDFLPAYRAALAPLLDRTGVEVAGFTGDAGAVLADADVLLLPTVEEGSALVTYEAQASGCVPLVSTAAGADLVEGATGLTHRVGDIVTLTAQLDRLERDRGELERMSRAASARATELGWAAAAERLAGAYREAVWLQAGAPGAAGAGEGPRVRAG